MGPSIVDPLALLLTFIILSNIIDYERPRELVELRVGVSAIPGNEGVITFFLYSSILRYRDGGDSYGV